MTVCHGRVWDQGASVGPPEGPDDRVRRCGGRMDGAIRSAQLNQYHHSPAGSPDRGNDVAALPVIVRVLQEQDASRAAGVSMQAIQPRARICAASTSRHAITSLVWVAWPGPAWPAARSPLAEAAY